MKDPGNTEWLESWVREALSAALEAIEPFHLEDDDTIAEMPPEIGELFLDRLDESDESAVEADRLFREAVTDSVRVAHHTGLWNARVAWLLAFWLNRDTYRRRQQFHHDEVDPLADAILRVHGRALLTCGEILTLAENGYGSGARARWRTLHEVEVTAFLLRNGDAELGSAYLDHELVQSKVLAETLLADMPANGDPEYRADLQERIEAATAVLERRGSRFARDYAWAAAVLLPGDAPGFRSLERAADAAQLRSAYRDASDFVHAGGLGTGLALTYGDDPLYVDPRDDGIPEVVCGTVEALASATDSLRWAALDVVEPFEASMIVDAILRYFEYTQRAFSHLTVPNSPAPRRDRPRPAGPIEPASSG